MYLASHVLLRWPTSDAPIAFVISTVVCLKTIVSHGIWHRTKTASECWTSHWFHFLEPGYHPCFSIRIVMNNRFIKEHITSFSRKHKDFFIVYIPDEYNINSYKS